jgi:hypothetical protein
LFLLPRLPRWGGGGEGMVADVGSENPENDVLGDVGGVIGDAL